MPLEQIVADRSALVESRVAAQSEPNAEFVCTMHNNKTDFGSGCSSGCGFCLVHLNSP